MWCALSNSVLSRAVFTGDVLGAREYYPSTRVVSSQLQTYATYPLIILKIYM